MKRRVLDCCVVQIQDWKVNTWITEVIIDIHVIQALEVGTS